MNYYLVNNYNNQEFNSYKEKKNKQHFTAHKYFHSHGPVIKQFYYFELQNVKLEKRQDFVNRKLHFSHVHALNTLKFLSFCQPSITKKCICSSLLKSSFILPQFISCTGVYIWQKYQQRLFSQLCVTSSLKCVSFIIIFFFQYLAHSLASQLFLPFVCAPYCMQI